MVLVAPGDVVPVDGIVAAGVAVLDESALTGEVRPAERGPGRPGASGVVNAGGPFSLRASGTAAESTYAGIVRLVSEAENSQAPFVRLADRYAMWFLPLTLAVAGVAWALGGAARAVAVLVVATPCPLILAAPVALVSGLSAAARRGVVVKSGGVLERLASCTTLVLDKTGTLTVGQPEVTAVIPAGTGDLDREEILSLAASLDQVSGHVLAAAVVRAAAEHGSPMSQPAAVTEVAGQGITGTVGGRVVRLGRAGWAGAAETEPWVRAARRRARLDGALTVFAAVDGQPAGVLLLEDRIRPDARQTIRALRHGGISRIVLATGDRAEAADAVGALTGVDEVLAELTPAGQAGRGAPRAAPGTGDHDRRRDQRRPRAGPGRRGDRHGSHGAPPRRRKRRTRCSPSIRSAASARWPHWPGVPGGSPCRACWPAWACRWPRWASPPPGCCPRCGARCCRRPSTSR